MVLGIIAEYNPFHNGHLYHLLQSKEKSNSDTCIAIIGGNFTQRGNTSLIDKWSKTKIALANGIDLILELPLLYSISSAENFADGAIKILNSLNIVDTISFGSETENIDKLNTIANILYNKPKKYQESFENHFRSGVSTAKAREQAIVEYLADSSYSQIISSSNNILGIEYLKALTKYHSKISPICVTRKDTNHSSLEHSENLASGTYIRNLIQNDKLETARNFLTPSSYSILSKNLSLGHFVSDISCFQDIIIYKLRTMNISDIANLPDVSEGLEYTIKKSANSCNSISELIKTCTSKRYTSSRISRILLYCLLNISKKNMDTSKRVIPYIRVLGSNHKGQNLISAISQKNPKLNIVTSVKKFIDNSNNKDLKLMMEKDCLATDIYTLGFTKGSTAGLDYTMPILK